MCKECDWERIALGKLSFDKLCDCGSARWVRVARGFEDAYLPAKMAGVLVYRCLRCDQLHDLFPLPEA